MLINKVEVRLGTLLGHFDQNVKMQSRSGHPLVDRNKIKWLRFKLLGYPEITP